MTINIGDVSVSIPTAISNWAKESDDNRTEFDGMIQSIMYAVNKVVKERNGLSENPYQRVYEEQLKLAEEAGISKESVDKYIRESYDELKKGQTASEKDLFLKLLNLIGK